MPGAVAPASEVLLQHGPCSVLLRASLRVAVALDALPGGIPSVWEGIARQRLSSLHAVIRIAATDRQEAERLIAHASAHPLAPFTRRSQAVCLALIAALLPADQGGAEPSGSEPGKPLCDYFADLFRFGTGWLGWPPSEVWTASIAELEAAFLAHVDRVVMITPGAVPANKDKGAGVYTKERLQQIEEQGFDPSFDREGLRALKAKYQ